MILPVILGLAILAAGCWLMYVIGKAALIAGGEPGDDFDPMMAFSLGFGLTVIAAGVLVLAWVIGQAITGGL